MSADSEFSPSVIADLLKTAIAAAQTAGAYAAASRDRRTETLSVAAHDVKLKLDVESQMEAERVIRARHPGHLVLGEETASSAPAVNGHDEFEWIIDPIDGTVNFTHGLPFWCCSVAVRKGRRVLAGAVFAPALGDLYAAAVGVPATRNGQPLRVSSVPTLNKALVMTGLDQKITTRMDRLDVFRALADNVQKVRVMGAAAIDICRVAAGEADAYFESGIYTWDIAAAGLIVEQAGGKIETLDDDGRHRLCFMATNGLIHDALRDLILGIMISPPPPSPGHRPGTERGRRRPAAISPSALP